MRKRCVRQLPYLAGHSGCNEIVKGCKADFVKHSLKNNADTISFVAGIRLSKRTEQEATTNLFFSSLRAHVAAQELVGRGKHICSGA